MGNLKFGVIGCGHIGKRHAKMILNNSKCELIALADIASKDLLEIDDIEVPFYRTGKELLNAHPEIDLVCVCTPNGTHYSEAKRSLLEEKHVVIEKPMGLNSERCQELIDISREVNKQIFCVMQNRYSPPAKWLKSMVEERKLGEIYSVQINCHWNRDDRYYKPGGVQHPWKGSKDLDGGTLFTQFSHFIDLMYWIFGDIENIQGKFKNFSHHKTIQFEDSGVIFFDFIDEGLGSLNYSTSVWNQNLESSITVIGEKGTIKVGGQYMNEVVYCHVEGYVLEKLEKSNPANDYGSYKGSANNHPYVFENIVDVLNERELITTNAEEGLKVVDIIERIYKAKNTK